MILPEALRMARSNLWAHKMRSVLTILGVIIGIGSVLTMVTLGSSFEESIVGEFDSVDQKTVYVYSSLTPLGQGPPDCMQSCNIFTDVDRQALANLTGVERVVVSIDIAATSLSWQGREMTYERLTATVPEADEVRDTSLYISGGPFQSGQPQVVLGFDIAKQLAGDTGTNVSAGDDLVVRFPDGHETACKVAGILEKDETFFGDRNTRVFVPVDPFHTTTRASPTTGEVVRVYSGFTVIASDVRDVDEVRDAVDDYIQESSDGSRLKLEKQELAVDTASDIQGQISNAFDQFTIFIGAIGGVSLVVGAIGIANIMLVSVTERTREIGVMKAIGATDAEILLLFLLESILIGLAGSVLGIGLGILGGYGLVNSGIFGDDFPFVLPWDWVGISVAVGIGVGVVAGFLPARRATRIEPVQALSYE